MFRYFQLIFQGFIYLGVIFVGYCSAQDFQSSTTSSAIPLAKDTVNETPLFESETWSLPLALNESNSAVTDYNLDGKSDLVTLDPEGRLIVLISGQGSFAAEKLSLVVENPSQAQILIPSRLGLEEIAVIYPLTAKLRFLSPNDTKEKANGAVRSFSLKLPVSKSSKFFFGSFLSAKGSQFLHVENRKVEIVNPTSGESRIVKIETELLNPVILGSRFDQNKNREELILCGLFSKSQLCRKLLIEETRVLQGKWIELPQNFHTRQFVCSDLDGDTLNDCLLLSDQIFGWWVAWDMQSFSLERPASSLEIPTESQSLLVGDFNGDSRGDVAFLKPGQLKAKIYLSSVKTKIDSAANSKHAAIPKTKNSTGPYVCLNYDPEGEPKWGNRLLDDCSPGWAFYGAQDMGGPTRSPEKVAVNGTCCRLPYDDILTGEKKSVTESCPDDFVAVGSRTNIFCPLCIQEMICEKINTTRYQLGPEREAKYWGIGGEMWFFSDPYLEDQIPLAIRYGITRIAFLEFDTDGCIGDPPGSLLVRKGRTCKQLAFRQLQFRGIPGDPKQGTPVKMYPDCSQLDDYYNPTSGCR